MCRAEDALPLASDGTGYSICSRDPSPHFGLKKRTEPDGPVLHTLFILNRAVYYFGPPPFFPSFLGMTNVASQVGLMVYSQVSPEITLIVYVPGTLKIPPAGI